MDAWRGRGGEERKVCQMDGSIKQRGVELEEEGLSWHQRRGDKEGLRKRKLKRELKIFGGRTQQR